MSLFLPRLTPVLLALAIVVPGARAAQAQFTLLNSLFDSGSAPQRSTGEGSSVALAGNFAVVGTPDADLGATSSGLVRVYDTTTGALTYTLPNPDPAYSSYFGYLVNVSGHRVAISALVGGNSGTGGSRVFVYDLAGATPTTPWLTLSNPVAAAWGGFGSAVALVGRRLAISTPGYTPGATAGGMVFVFDLEGPTPSVPMLTLTHPQPTNYLDFGTALALSGSRLLVGAPGDSTGSPAAGVVHLYDLGSATPAVPYMTLTNPAPLTDKQFGGRVAVDGDLVAVSAQLNGTGPLRVRVFDLASGTPNEPKVLVTDPRLGASSSFSPGLALGAQRLTVGWQAGNPGNAMAPGSAYIYDLSAAQPAVPVLVITNSPRLYDDGFGTALALDGARLLVGASGDERGASFSGSAQLFNLAGATPGVPDAVLASPSPASGTQFGARVAMAGSRAAVASLWDGRQVGNGVVYLYDLTGAMATGPVLVVTNPGPDIQTGFAYSLALSASYLVVSAQDANAGATYAGKAFVYDLAGLSPAVPMLTLTNPGPVNGEHFGAAVALSGTTVIIGTPGEFTNPHRYGAAYVYDIAATSAAVPILTLTNPAPRDGAWFGDAIAMDGLRVVIGARNQSAYASFAGAAYVYDLAGATPDLPLLVITNPTPASEDAFGSAVAVFGTKVVIGASGKDTGATNAGIVYVYDMAGAQPAIPSLVLTNPQPLARDAFGSALALHGTLLVVGAHRDGGVAPQGDSVYVYDLAGASPAVPIGTLANPSPGTSDSFGLAVATDGLRVLVGAPTDDAGAVDRGAAYVYIRHPALSVTPAAPGLATLSWTPTNAPGFVLQYTDSLLPTNWRNAPSGVANPVTVPTTGQGRFYRVAQP